MTKIINLGAHCSECIHYQGIRSFMYCMALQKRITARKTPKYCNHYKKNRQLYINLHQLCKNTALYLHLV